MRKGQRFHPIRLREALARRALTVRSLATLAGISPGTVQAALRGDELALRSVSAISLALEKAVELPHPDLLLFEGGVPESEKLNGSGAQTTAPKPSLEVGDSAARTSAPA